MGENGRAVALHMLVEPDAGAGLGYDRSERGLTDLKRIAPRVVSVGGFDGRSLSAVQFAASGWFDTTSENLCGSKLL
jgi:hypothetical protein